MVLSLLVNIIKKGLNGENMDHLFIATTELRNRLQNLLLGIPIVSNSNIQE